MNTVRLPKLTAYLLVLIIRPEHASLKDRGRAEYASVDDQEALDALQWVSRREGILPALETAHAFAELRKLAPTMSPDQTIVVCFSGRGDKDVEAVAERLGGMHV